MSFAEAFTQTFPAPEWWRRLDSSQRLLGIALIISTVAHAALLAVQFVAPEEFRMKPNDQALDVILVNAKHASRPTKAQALAQANLDGGGNDAKGRAQSFLPDTKRSQEGDQLQAAAARIQQLEAEQRSLMTAVKNPPARVQRQDPLSQQNPDPTQALRAVEGTDQRDAAQAILRREAEIAKRIADENARPKRGYVTPATREVEYATYYKHWADKVERVGNNNYPDSARGRTYRLVMTVSVFANGRVEKVEIEQSSGSKEIDAAARRIVKKGEPYEIFTKEMLAQYGVLDLTMTWTFSRTEALSVEAQK